MDTVGIAVVAAVEAMECKAETGVGEDDADVEVNVAPACGVRGEDADDGNDVVVVVAAAAAAPGRVKVVIG
jgi:hypothetical protein